MERSGTSSHYRNISDFGLAFFLYYHSPSLLLSAPFFLAFMGLPLHPTKTATEGIVACLPTNDNVIKRKQRTMKLIIIDRKAWERHCSDFADFIHRIEQLIGNPPETDEWLDNEAVCRRLGISKRTLQSYRDTGKIPFSMIGHKCYYKESDITELLSTDME